MLLARVIGNATATIGHPSLRAQRLLLVQPLRSLTVEPVLSLDRLGAARGALVVISSDGRGARELVNDERSPVRWTVLGIVDDDAESQGAGKEERA